jgi:hypothetical protein
VNRLQRVRFELAQCREDWQLRAAKLQLAYPQMFAVMSTRVGYNDQLFVNMYCEMLSAIGMGKLTTYRLRLLRKACQEYRKEMQSERKRTQAGEETKTRPG